MPDAAFPPHVSPHGIAPVLGFLTCDSDVLRAAAARAVAALAEAHPAEAEPALAAALLDEDPDVRSDAMEGLARLAPAGASEMFLYSLRGDPVREVKLAAIDGLARIGARDAVPLLRALTLSRAEDQVAWEDEGADWEDWLDVQIAAIRALGGLGAVEAIGDMLGAWSDEMGQSLDVVVFEALAGMGDPGLAALLELIGAGEGLTRSRAVTALLRLGPEHLAEVHGDLLRADDPDLRALAVAALPEGDPLLAELAAADPSPQVRVAALARVPELAAQALGDPDPKVQAEALRRLRPPLDAGFAETLADNLLAWVRTAPPALMTAAVDALPCWAGARAAPELLSLLADADRPLEARVAAVRALDHIDPKTPTPTLAAALANPAQQVRTALLVGLASRAKQGDAEAEAALARAVAGDHPKAQEAVPGRADPPDARDAATPKGEGAPRALRITPDGEIVEASEPQDAGGSTLAAILGEALPAPGPEAEETPEESAGKRRKRRPVEGPDEVAGALALEAIMTAADVPSEAIAAALLSRTEAPDDHLRRAAWAGLARQFEGSEPGEAVRAAARIALASDDPVVRHAAYALLLSGTPEPAALAAAAGEGDALIRAMAVPRLPKNHALAALADPALVVRDAALLRLLDIGGSEDIAQAVTQIAAAERADTLAVLVQRSDVARGEVLAQLAAEDLPRRRALILLQGLAPVA